MKYLFLDIDGVLNTGRNDYLDPDKYSHHFDARAVANLAEIIKRTGARIVISSSWRHMGLTKLQELWHKWELPGEVIGITPGVWGEDEWFPTRGDEIRAWLEKQQLPYSYAVLDDMDDHLPNQEERWIIVNPHYGITKADMKRAIAILNKEIISSNGKRI